MRIIVALLVALLVPSLAIDAYLGSAVSLQAGTPTTLDVYFSSLVKIPMCTLQVTADVDTDLTVTRYVFIDTSTSLVTGFTGLNFGTGVNIAAGFTIAVTNGATITATLSTPELSAEALALVTASGSVPGVLRWDASAETWQRIDIEPFSAEDAKISVSLPGPGTYVFVAVKTEVQVNFGTPRVAYANANQTLQFNNGEASITFRSRRNAVLTVNKRTTTQHEPIPFGTPLKVYLNIAHTGEGAAAGAHDSVIRYKYTAQALADVGLTTADAAALRLAFWSDANAKWEIPSSGGSVDTSAMVVAQATTHFSEWAVVANSAFKLGSSVLLTVMASMTAALALAFAPWSA